MDAPQTEREKAQNITRRPRVRDPLAEFERQLIRERTHAGLRAARARGRLGGRPKALTASKQKRAVELYLEKQLAVQEICKIMGISKPDPLCLCPSGAIFLIARLLPLPTRKASGCPKYHEDKNGKSRPKKRQQRPARLTRHPHPDRSPFSAACRLAANLTPPHGFRPISTTQAMLEYAAPIMAYVENGTVADPNDALQVGLLLWNSTLPVPVAMRQARSAIVAQIETTLQMDRQEAEAFFER